MMALDPTKLVSKLDGLNTTQQSIETVSSYCIFYRKEAKKVVSTWEAEFNSTSNGEKRLAMLYLANDILQRSRKKGPEYVNEFFRVLPRAVQSMMRRAEVKARKALERLVAIWEERRVFGASGGKPFRDALQGAELPRRSSSGVAPVANGLASPRASLGLGSLGLEGGHAPALEALREAERASAHTAQTAAACGPALQLDPPPREAEAAGGAVSEAAAAALAEASATERAAGRLRGVAAALEARGAAARGEAAALAQRAAALAELAKRAAVAPPPGAGSPEAPAMEEDADEDMYSPTAADAAAAALEADAAAWDPQPAGLPIPASTAAAELAAGPGPPASQPSAHDMPLPAHQAPRPPASGFAAMAAAMPAGPAGASSEQPAAPEAAPQDTPDVDMAAALAAQLAASGGASALMQALASLPKDQQQEIGLDMAAMVSAGINVGGAGAELYEPGQ